MGRYFPLLLLRSALARTTVQPEMTGTWISIARPSRWGRSLCPIAWNLPLLSPSTAASTDHCSGASTNKVIVASRQVPGSVGDPQDPSALPVRSSRLIAYASSLWTTRPKRPPPTGSGLTAPDHETDTAPFSSWISYQLVSVPCANRSRQRSANRFQASTSRGSSPCSVS